ncbi:hypothetical protein V1522DRAFT_410347 [Lipomyces starkeyi]
MMVSGLIARIFVFLFMLARNTQCLLNVSTFSTPAHSPHRSNSHLNQYLLIYYLGLTKSISRRTFSHDVCYHIRSRISFQSHDLDLFFVPNTFCESFDSDCCYIHDICR